MNGRDITVFGLGAVVTGSLLYYWSTRNPPVTVSKETHDEDVNTEEESQRPSNSVCVSDATNEIVDSEDDSQRPLNPVTVSDETHVKEVITEGNQRPLNSVCVSDATNEIVDSEDYSQRPSNSVTVSDETHVKEVITEENQRPLNSVPPEVSTGEGSQRSLDSASLKVMTGAESQRSIDLDSNELELDGGNCDSINVYPSEPPTYQCDQEEPPSYSSNVYLDAEPTCQHNQPPSCFEFDAVILHTSHDEVQAKECQKFLEQHSMIGNVRADVGFIDDVILPGTYTIDGLCKLFLKCRLVLVFHTKNFKKDGLIEYAKLINLKQAVEEADKNNRIIPLLADNEALSIDLSVLEPVSCYDENFSRKMSKLFTHWRNNLP